MPRCNQVINIGGKPIDYVSEYKYLGFVFDEHMNFITGTSILANSGNRAPSSIISKTRSIKDMHFSNYVKLLNSGVLPILTYASSVWGHDRYCDIENIIKQSLRFYLGVPKNTPIPFLYLISDVLLVHYETIICKARLYNRLVKFENTRLSKRIFLNDVLSDNGWFSDLLKCCTMINYNLSGNLTDAIAINLFRTKCSIANKEENLCRACGMSKLSIFVSLYENNEKFYLRNNILVSKAKRAILNQLLSGCLKLNVETGRYTQTSFNLRFCNICKNKVEDTFHFLFECPAYHVPRTIMFKKCNVSTNVDNNVYLSLVTKLLSENVNTFANCIHDFWQIRNRNIFN